MGWLEPRVASKKHPAIKIDDIVSFFQQLSTLLNAGNPLLHSLRMCSQESESFKFCAILKDISNKVSQGETFYKSASNFPKVFEIQWLEMIRTGEVSGQLGMIMLKLNDNIQKSQATKNKVKGALTYPFILLSVAFAAIFIMLWKVIPTFAAFFKDFGKKLPPITQFVVNLSNFIAAYGIHIIVGIGVFTFLFKKYRATTKGGRNVEMVLMALPILGEITIQAAMEKFATTLALLLKSGVPLLESLRTVQEVFKTDPVYSTCMGQIYSSVARGNNFTASLAGTKLFTPMLISMCRTGEESGKLSEVLEEAGKYYRDKLEVLVLRFTSMLEPVIVIGMGVVVGGMLASIYLPMFSLAGG